MCVWCGSYVVVVLVVVCCLYYVEFVELFDCVFLVIFGIGFYVVWLVVGEECMVGIWIYDDF